jgi:hypothetical protein
MREKIVVIDENGVLRPIGGLPGQIHEHQQLTVTIEDSTGQAGRIADADPTVSLESVRNALARIPGTLAQMNHAQRDER